MSARIVAKKKKRDKNSGICHHAVERQCAAVMRIRKMQALSNETPRRKTRKTDSRSCPDLMYQRAERRGGVRRRWNRLQMRAMPRD